MSEALDARATTCLGGAYTLEVTSPGLDRPLTKPRHWRRARLRKVAVRTAEDDSSLARVGDADEDGVELLVDDSYGAWDTPRSSTPSSRWSSKTHPRPRLPSWHSEEGSR